MPEPIGIIASLIEIWNFLRGFLRRKSPMKRLLDDFQISALSHIKLTSGAEGTLIEAVIPAEVDILNTVKPPSLGIANLSLMQRHRIRHLNRLWPFSRIWKDKPLRVIRLEVVSSRNHSQQISDLSPISRRYGVRFDGTQHFSDHVEPDGKTYWLFTCEVTTDVGTELIQRMVKPFDWESV